MTSPPEESDRRIADEVLPAPADDLAVPEGLNRLQPWHRPRKQLVREKQWIHHSERLIRTEKGKPGLPILRKEKPEVRYLSLPGKDYLDVRQLADICQQNGCSLTSTGFEAGGDRNPVVARANVSRQQLIATNQITGDSHIFPRRFEDIIPSNGQAYKDLIRRGPFHIVNIDACGSIAKPADNHASRLIEAIHRILELQINFKTGPWLLFLTVDARPASVARKTLDRLCETIFANAAEKENFRDRASTLLNCGDEDIKDTANRMSKIPGQGFLRLFSLGLAKWFLHLAREKQWDVYTHQPYCYSTMPLGDDTPTMVCLAFEFLPPPPGLPDSFEVSHADPVPAAERGDTSIRAADQISKMTNVDSRMREDRELHDRMAENLRIWLVKAGYDPAVVATVGA